MTRGQPDTEVIGRHLQALEDALTHLHPRAGSTAAQLRTDTALRWTVERGLQLCAQNALAVATHIAAASGADAAEYATAIDRLAELKTLPAAFAARFRAIAGFRNVLVHGYLAVDLQIVEDILHNHLRDFVEFVDTIDRWLRTSRTGLSQ